MTRSAEIAIVGGGIIGASIAYHLAARGQSGIVVFEREEALGTGSTAKCAGGVRLQFSTPENISLSRISIDALKRFKDELGEPVDFEQNGYLFLLSDEIAMEKFRHNAKCQNQMGVPVEIMTPEEAQRIVPGLRINDLVGATYCGEEGIANPHAILQGYAKRAKAFGVSLHRSSEVQALRVKQGRISSLIAGDEEWEVGLVVNAAGPWARKVGQLAGIHVPVNPVRRMLFITQPLEWIPKRFPLLIDWMTGVYMHEESSGMLIGESDPNEQPSFNQQVDWEFLAGVTEHAIHRLPQLETTEIKTSWAGLYEVSPDHNAILGHVPEIENFICANGFSGHGMQHAPAVGLLIAELIINGATHSADISAYSIERFLHGQLISEENII